MINKILVPVDGSKIALRALEFAMEIGGKFGSEIIVINIDVPYDLSRIKPPRRDKNGNVIPVEAAAPTPLEEAEKDDTDLIIMGNRGMGVLAGFFLGSVSTKVSQSAHCPVTIVK